MLIPSRSRWLALLGFAASGAAWVWQPAAPIYSDLDRVYYLPDPDLGWRLVEPGHLLLGVDALVLVALCVALSFVAARFSERRGASATAVVAAFLACLPALAVIALGRFPLGAQLDAPTDRVVAPEGIEGGLEGLSSGRWTSDGTHARGLLAKVPAGGEVFDTRFGELQSAVLIGDPSDLRQPLSVRVEARSASADTGVDSRTKSTLDYLQVSEHPLIAFELTQLKGAKQISPDTVEFAAQGRFELMRSAHSTPLTGSLKRLDAAARKRLAIDSKAAFMVSASFVVHIADTALKAKAQSFDADEIEIQVELIFVPSQSPTP